LAKSDAIPIRRIAVPRLKGVDAPCLFLGAAWAAARFDRKGIVKAAVQTARNLVILIVDLLLS
jgi:hypothetical protein